MQNKIYKTVREFKEDLPNVLNTIKNLEALALTYLHSYELLKKMCVLETIDGGYNFGELTTKKNIAEEYETYIDLTTRAEYLKDKVKELSVKRV